MSQLRQQLETAFWETVEAARRGEIGWPRPYADRREQYFDGSLPPEFFDRMAAELVKNHKAEKGDQP